MTTTAHRLVLRGTTPATTEPRIAPATPFHRSRRAWLPLLLAAAWMLGTFGMFWTGELADRVPNPGQLCLFVLAATSAFCIGYAAQIRRRHNPRPVAHTTRTAEMRRVRRLVLASAVYYVALGLALLVEYGATGPGSVWTSIQDPAQAYVNKFVVYQQQQDTGRVNPVIQLLTLLGALGAVLIPLLAIYWQRLSVSLRLLGLTGMGVYALFFLYIGTLKGLGDFVVMIGAALLVAAARTGGSERSRKRTRGRRRPVVAVVAVVTALFCAYMVKSQADRVDQFGTQDRVRANPAVEQVVGPHLATGVAALTLYPTHGYLGLAYNLQTPFAWSHGLGSTPAVTSYVGQYLDVETDQYPAYPTRTEERTGWPAGLYWSTIYPWLASDLTFPGTLAFMALLGWFFAATWRAAVAGRILPTLIFVQLGLVIAYIPANNQVGMSRPGAIGFATLLVLLAWSTANGRAASRANKLP